VVLFVGWLEADSVFETSCHVLAFGHDEGSGDYGSDDARYLDAG